MKAPIKYPLIFLLLLGAIYMLSKIYFHIQYEKDFNKKLVTIPEFEFMDIYSKKAITDKNLKEGTPVLFIYLNTECHFCIDETQIIRENIKEFRNCQIVIVSIEEPDILVKYAENYNLKGLDNLFFLYDKDLKFEEIFGESPFPSSFVYGKKGKLSKIFKGKPRMDDLLKQINK